MLKSRLYIFLKPQEFNKLNVGLFLNLGVKILISLEHSFKVSKWRWSGWLWLINIKSHLLNSFFQFPSVGLSSHHPFVKAGPIAQGSVANLKSSFSKIKKAWLKYFNLTMLSFFNFEDSLILGILLIIEKTILLFLIWYLIWFFF